MRTRAGRVCSGRTSGLVGVPLLDRILFLLLVGVLCARPLISESFARVDLSFLPAEAAVGATPATTIWLDTILLASAALVWIRRRQPRPRAGVISVALGLLLVAVVVSLAAADDKRLAANAGAHLFVMMLAATALVRVMRARWMIHLLIAAVLASGVTNAAKCISQRLYEFDELLQYWEEQKVTLAEGGADLDSPTLVNYERRLRSGEAFGHLYHPNVTASCLTMCVLVAVGLFIGVLHRPELDANRRTAAALVAGVLGLVLAVGLWLTGSAGAAVAAILAGGLLLGFGVARGWIARRLRGVFALLVIAYVGIIAAGAGYGLLKGTLPQASLAFRWYYWQAAARTIAGAPLTGIGRENFQAAYLLHKSAESTEEVGNPHNLWLSLVVELGPLGLMAGILLIGTAVYSALRGLREAGRAPPAPAGRGALVAVASGVLLIQAVFSGEQFSAPGIPLLWAALVAGVWILAFVVAHSLIAQVDEDPATTGWLVAGLAAALCAALVHNLIGFSLLTPAGLSIFVALTAGAQALQRKPSGREAERNAIGTDSAAGIALPVGVSVLLVAAYVWAVAAPTTRTEAALDRVKARLRAATTSPAAYAALEQGSAILRLDRWLWDPAPSRWLAEMALHLASDPALADDVRQKWLVLAEGYAAEANRRNRRSFATRQLQARISQARGERTGNLDLLREAEALWEMGAVPLYPTNPRTRIAAAKAQFQLWKQKGETGFARRALDNYQAALAIDATRLPEVAAKLRPAELRVIRQHLDELRTAGFDSAEGSAPTSEPAP